ncbi:putative receptor-like protein kinase [Nymphaea thermarum]|nr:putative receptor-like protein kinase [Nymphaea thermarum]
MSCVHRDLANSGLNGTISNSFAEFTTIQSLNLSGNHLQGQIPPFLGELAALTSLTDAVGRGRLPLVSVNDWVYTYMDIVGITNDFQRVIGKGGSATVYYGRMKNGIEVAVKMLNGSLARGLKEFTSEVKLLMGINHKCLVSLIGFCEEDAKVILMYEYMSNGNLHNLLAANSLKELPWKKRIHIAISAASGLEYLHSGCTPSIIHRDVKTSNILLNEKMEAKLSDFGLSKSSHVDDTVCVLTAVAGTPGYMDPEYFRTNKLTRKSDVYSFGIVLLELISGRPAIFKTDEIVHIVQWITPKLLQEDIVSVVDPRFQGQYNCNSIWIVAKTAMKCTAEKAAMRPTMTDVLNRLKEAMELEDNVPESGNSIVQYHSSSAPWSYCNEAEYGSTSFLEPRLYHGIRATAAAPASHRLLIGVSRRLIGVSCRRPTVAHTAAARLLLTSPAHRSLPLVTRNFIARPKAPSLAATHCCHLAVRLVIVLHRQLPVSIIAGPSLAATPLSLQLHRLLLTSARRCSTHLCSLTATPPSLPNCRRPSAGHRLLLTSVRRLLDVVLRCRHPATVAW